MACKQTRGRDVRTIFISDVHLGCKHSRADALVQFLEAHQPEHLFFVGDFIDGWKLKRFWHWQPAYTRLVHRLLTLVDGGTRLYYTPGNHDDFLRGFLRDYGVIDIKNEFIYVTADGRRLLITHGDQFDRFERSARWFTMLLSYVYDVILSANRLAGRFQGQSQRRNYAFSARIKLLCKRFAMFVSDFEGQLVEHARRQRCDGVVCGHIHRPAITKAGEITYFNTGDWVEHCTALVEYTHGGMELLFLAPNDETGQLDVVERIRAPHQPRRPQRVAVHAEFDDRLGQSDDQGWEDPELDESPAPAGSAACVSHAATRHRPARCTQHTGPSPTAGLAERGLNVVSRLWNYPRQCWGFFVGICREGLRSTPLDCLEPNESL